MLPKKQYRKAIKGPNKAFSTQEKIVLIGIGFFFLICIVIAVISGSGSSKPAEPKVTKIASTIPAASEPALSADPIERISQIVNKVYSGLEVDIFTRDAQFGNATNGPWQVSVTSPLGAFHSCSGAKSVIYDITKGLYTDDLIRSNLLSVQVSLSDQAQASLGRNDGLPLTKEMWDGNGSSNLARALAASATGRINGLPEEQQTYWDSINGNCNP